MDVGIMVSKVGCWDVQQRKVGIQVELGMLRRLNSRCQ